MILLSGVIVVTTSISPSIGNGDSPALVWLFSKLVGLGITVVFILPVAYGMRWISERLARRSSYGFSYVDPFLAAAIFAVGALGLWHAVSVFQSLSLDGVRTLLGVLLVGGVFLIFAGIGTEVAMAWIFSFTTAALFVKHLRVTAIARQVVRSISFLWAWLKFPRLWYRYAAATDRTFVGALYVLLGESRKAIADEVATVQPKSTATGRGQPTWFGRHVVTFGLIIVITIVFVVQIRLAGSTATPRAVAEWLFRNQPDIGWMLAPFLHKGLYHYFRNIVLLGFAGYFIEEHVSHRTYLIGVVVVGYASTAAHAAYLLATNEGPVMVIGASGMTIAVVTYSGVHLFLSHNLLPDIDGLLSWTKTYLSRLRSEPVVTVHTSLLYFTMIIGLIYPPVQILNDWSGVFSQNSEAAIVAHLVGVGYGLLIAVVHSRYTTLGLTQRCLNELESP